MIIYIQKVNIKHQTKRYINTMKKWTGDKHIKDFLVTKIKNNKTKCLFL